MPLTEGHHDFDPEYERLRLLETVDSLWREHADGEKWALYISDQYCAVGLLAGKAAFTLLDKLGQAHGYSYTTHLERVLHPGGELSYRAAYWHSGIYKRAVLPVPPAQTDPAELSLQTANDDSFMVKILEETVFRREDACIEDALAAQFTEGKLMERPGDPAEFLAHKMAAQLLGEKPDD